MKVVAPSPAEYHLKLLLFEPEVLCDEVEELYVLLLHILQHLGKREMSSLLEVVGIKVKYQVCTKPSLLFHRPVGWVPVVGGGVVNMPWRRLCDVGVQLLCPPECLVAEHVVLFPENEGPLPPAKTEGKREMLRAVVTLESFPQELSGAVVDGIRLVLGRVVGGVVVWLWLVINVCGSSSSASPCLCGSFRSPCSPTQAAQGLNHRVHRGHRGFHRENRR